MLSLTSCVTENDIIPLLLPPKFWVYRHATPSVLTLSFEMTNNQLKFLNKQLGLGVLVSGLS